MDETAFTAVREIARFVAETTAENIPAPVFERAARTVADTVGVMLGGSADTLPAALAEGIKSAGHSTVIAEGFRRVEMGDAMMLNAVFACSTELDEGTRPTGHPAMHVLPPALALAQELDTTGEEFLVAFIVGYEVQARLQRAARLRGLVHCHGNYGHLGAVATIKKLRGATAREITSALAGVANFASATSYSLPYAGATIHSGAPAVSGTTALLVDRMTSVGYTGLEETVAEVFGRILGEEFQPDTLVDGLGDGFAIEENYVKFHSTCGHVHAPLEALVDALGQGRYPWTVEPVPPQNIRKVTVTVGQRAAELNSIPSAELPAPSFALAGRFSIPISVAAFLVNGAADPAAFSEESLSDPELRALAQRIEIIADPEYDEVFPDLHRSEVEVTMTDGTVSRGRCDNPYGNSKNPATDEHIKQKFRQLLERFPHVDADSLWSSILELRSADSLRGFGEASLVSPTV